MFDFVRQHTKTMMFVLFLLIIPSFVLFGVEGYRQSGDNGPVAARVAGKDISQSEWDAAHKAESDRLRETVPNLDPKLLDSAEARYATLERLVRERVLSQAAAASHMTATDARLARDLQENPTIASLRKPDGSLDLDRYRQLAASQGLTPEGFEARVRQDLAVRQVEGAVTSSSFAGKGSADVALNAFFERREVQIANFSPRDFVQKVSISEADLEAFYKANPALFQAPEQAKVQYLVLDIDAVKKTISVSESDLKSYYEQNASRLSGPEERRASHILIAASKDAPEGERLKAKARAEELQAQAKKSPEKFAELAKANSQDTGSAVNGGDLDFFARGSMVKPFEDAAFALAKGEVSEVVASDFGYHIIKLTDVKTPKTRSFDEMRAGLEADIKLQQAQRKFSESAEIFTNAVYEQSDSLAPVAEKLKLELKTATNVLRQPPVGTTGVLANPKLLSSIFGADAIEKKHNTEAVETAPSQLTSARVIEYTPARTLPLAEVRDLVRQRVVAQRAAELAKSEGVARLKAWTEAPSLAILPASVILSRDLAQNFPQQVLASALRADTSKLPTFVGVDLGAQGYAVLKINQVTPRVAPDAATAERDRAQYAQWWNNAEVQAYYGLLKDRFKVEILIKKSTSTANDSTSLANR